jgi:hypothetical protein
MMQSNFSGVQDKKSLSLKMSVPITLDPNYLNSFVKYPLPSAYSQII